MACPTATGATSRRERRSTWPQRSTAAGRWPAPTSISDAWATCSNPGRAINMGDGWETGRRRTPGHDWVIVALGHPGSIEAAVVDTLHFKGNYPESCSIQAAFVEGGNEARIEAQSLFWRESLPAQKLEMHQEHRFERHLNALGPITPCTPEHLPDGGVSRLRLFGRPQLP
ncbi:hypothetical protein ACPA9J_06795 [Pseudomonas aeruginosa]